jgi:3-isopropylmalate/(R)-2-methylmalate dehydratase small subunit
MMEKFETLTGIAAPLMWSNVDTDMIIPIQRLVGTGRAGLGPHGFERFRNKPDFPLNRPEFKGASILLAAENFGCGSSREGAVWTLLGMGIRCVIAPSFGDIFHNNCFQNGVLPVRLPIEIIQRMAEAMEASPGNARVTVDLAKQVVITPWGEAVPFAVDARKRDALLSGLDEIAQTLQCAPEIAAWQARDRAARAWAWDSVSQN